MSPSTFSTTTSFKGIINHRREPWKAIFHRGRSAFFCRVQGDGGGDGSSVAGWWTAKICQEPADDHDCEADCIKCPSNAVSRPRQRFEEVDDIGLGTKRELPHVSVEIPDQKKQNSANDDWHYHQTEPNKGDEEVVDFHWLRHQRSGQFASIE